MNNLTIDRILADISNGCIPTPDEQNELSKSANKVKHMVESYVVEHELSSLVREVVYGGSFAKGTWLKNETDIDLFLKFYDSIDYYQFETYGKQIGMQALMEFSPYLRYSDHPYVEAIIGGIKVNIVPCFDVTVWRMEKCRRSFSISYFLYNQQTYTRTEKSGKNSKEISKIHSDLWGRNIY